MLEDVEIENYRCFATLRHSGFTRVNLIVGRNNSGKTALLEALEALVSADSPFLFYRSSIDRGELECIAPTQKALRLTRGAGFTAIALRLAPGFASALRSSTALRRGSNAL